MSRQKQMYNCIKSQLRNYGWKTLIIIGNSVPFYIRILIFLAYGRSVKVYFFDKTKCLKYAIIQIWFLAKIFFMQIHVSWSGEWSKPKWELLLPMLNWGRHLLKLNRTTKLPLQIQISFKCRLTFWHCVQYIYFL